MWSNAIAFINLAVDEAEMYLNPLSALHAMDTASSGAQAPEIIQGEACPTCQQKTLTLTEATREIPYFGLLHLFSMSCSSCGYHKADVESEKEEAPKKLTFAIDAEEDMKVRVIKSSHATIRIPHIATVESSDSSNGYVTNVEGILSRIRRQAETLRDNAEDESERKKAKSLLKKLQRIMWGQEEAKLILEDRSGQSAIISEKTIIEPLKTKKQARGA